MLCCVPPASCIDALAESIHGSTKLNPIAGEARFHAVDM